MFDDEYLTCMFRRITEISDFVMPDPLFRTLPYAGGGGLRVVVSTAAFHAGVRGLFTDFGGLKKTQLFFPHQLVKLSIVGSLRDRVVAYSASDRQGLNFESCVWRAVWSHPSHHPQEILLTQFILYVHKSGLKPSITSTNFFSPQVLEND